MNPGELIVPFRAGFQGASGRIGWNFFPRRRRKKKGNGGWMPSTESGREMMMTGRVEGGTGSECS